MDKFNIAFSGEILPDHNIERVKRRFAQAFQLEELNRTDAFFSGHKIILRRNLDKEEAARIFASLRQIGLDIHIEKVEPPPAEEAPAPRPEAANIGHTMATARARRKRQPGAPNVFDLHLSERAGHDNPPDEVSQTLVKAPLLAAGLVMLAFVLVCVRFLGQSGIVPVTGLGELAVDPREQVVVQAGEDLLFHDRAGILLEQRPAADFQMLPHSSFDFFSNGDLLLQRLAQPRDSEAWSLPVPGKQADSEPVVSLARCPLAGGSCTELVSNIGDAGFALDRRNEVIYLADAAKNSLTRLAGNGMIEASTSMQLASPLHLELQEGILYLTQAHSDAVLVLKPDVQDFGQQLDRVALSVEQSSQSGHIYPGDIAWLNDHWWAIMQSRDGSAAGLYRFTPRWKFVSQLPLPENANPDVLARWATRMLATDRQQKTIHRFDATGRAENEFISEAMTEALSTSARALELSRGLQGLILMILFVTAAGLMAFGILQTLRGKVYVPPADQGEQGFDINSADIYWLDPDPKAPARMRLLGYTMAALAALILLGGFVLGLSVWLMLALSILFAGLGGLYFALLRSAHCHLGTLDGRLILVDHNNTYRVGSDSTIQYFKNYVMIDDVIIYLGNKLVHRFSRTPLQQTFTPLVNRGIKVDRTTLRVKLIQARHPMWLGSGGLALALVLAALLSLAG